MNRNTGLMAVVIIGSFLLVSSRAWAESVEFLGRNQSVSIFRGRAAPVADWFAPDMQQAEGWETSTAGFGIGYGDDDDATVLEDMAGSYLTVYARSTFQAGDELSRLSHLQLSTRFDDGFVAYLNGVEIARSHVPRGRLTHETRAEPHEASDGLETFTVDVSLLRRGENVFAVELHNRNVGSTDLSFDPVLWGYDELPPATRITIGPIVQLLGRRSATILWETSREAPSRVEFGLDGAFDRVASDPRPKIQHEVRLEGLLPARRYSYRVASSRPPSESGLFMTEVDRATPHRIVVFGDNRSMHEDHRTVVERIIEERPLLVLNSGDLVCHGEDESEWRTFFEIEGDLLRDVPMYASLGNHEGDGILYRRHLALPTDTPQPEKYYVLRYGPSAFVILDQYLSDYDAGSEQHRWLAEQLGLLEADPTILHIFIILHHGPYDSGPHGSDLTVREDLVPLFRRHGVSAVISGHNHDYERSTVDGIKYVVSGGGGAPLYRPGRSSWTEVAERTHHYCVLDVDGPRVRFEARRPDGSTLDAFELFADVPRCENDDDCGREALTCTVDEVGSWLCRHGGCLWNCSSSNEEGVVEAGSRAGGDADVREVGDAGPRPDAGASVPRRPSSRSRCHCLAAGRRGSALDWLLGLLLGL